MINSSMPKHFKGLVYVQRKGSKSDGGASSSRIFSSDCFVYIRSSIFSFSLDLISRASLVRIAASAMFGMADK